MDTYPQVTITPFRRPAAAPIRYKVEVHEPPQQNVQAKEVVLSEPWTRSGDYDTTEEMFASFSPPLSIAFQQKILQELRQGNAFKFSLEGVLTLT
jgi:hypothetical protein